MATNLVIAHKDLDGSACVVLLNRFLEDRVRYILCDYNDVDKTVMDQLPRSDNKYKEIYIVDICPNEETCAHLNSLHNNGTKVKLMDHHVTRSWVNKYSWAIYDKDLCGCEIVYRNIKSTKNTSAYEDFTKSIGAWDLWKLDSPHRKRGEDLNAILKFIGLNDFIKMFTARPDQDKEQFVDILTWLSAKKDRYVKSIIDNQLHKSYVHSDGGGKQFKILFVTDYISDVGHAVLSHSEYEDLDYVVLVNPVMNSVSLRSRPTRADVAKISKNFGGGGHKAAAGFSKNLTGGMENKIASLLNRTEY